MLKHSESQDKNLYVKILKNRANFVYIFIKNNEYFF